MKIKINKECPHAMLPYKKHSLDAGWDLFSNQDCVIEPHSRLVVDTGIRMGIPAGWVGLIWPRSGLAVKSGIDVFAGVIDSGYRGVVKVCLYNSSFSEVSIKRDDRIAQIIFHRITKFDIEEVDSLADTERDCGGFGSTGK